MAGFEEIANVLATQQNSPTGSASSPQQGNQFFKVIDKFFGGIARDDKSKTLGAALDMEEIDPFTNSDFIQPEQINSLEVAGTGIPLNVNLFARTIGSDDTAYAYGKETTGGKVVLCKMANGSNAAPGNFLTLFTSTDGANLAYSVSELAFFKTTEATNNTYLFYTTTNNSGTITLKKFNLGTLTESTVGQLTGLNGSFDRPTMKIIFGDLYICNGNFIAKFAVDTTFTEKKFTLPNNLFAVDIEAVGDASIIFCRDIARALNESFGVWWDTITTTTFEDMFRISMGGPQWVINAKESINFFCAANNLGKFFRLTFPARGAIPIEVPGIVLKNIATDGPTAPICQPKMVSKKDKFIFFALTKTDKTGIYAIGQMDADKPIAVFLSKRYSTTDYSLHTPYSAIWHGPNFYGDFSDNGIAKSVRCATLNNPSRSSNAIYQSIWLDAGEPFRNKNFSVFVLATYPLPSGASVSPSIAFDYSSTFSNLTKPDGASHNVTNGLNAIFRNNQGNNKKVVSIKLAIASNGSNSPKVVAIGFGGQINSEIAPL